MKKLLKWTAIAAAAALLLIVLGRLTLPSLLGVGSPSEVAARFRAKMTNLPEGSKIITAQGTLLSTANVQRVKVKVTDACMKKWMVPAILAAEDQKFYTHGGVDYTAIVRCAFLNLKTGRTICGGSTVTQQILKRVELTADKTLVRKIREMALAWQLEAGVPKDEILEGWANEIFLGENAYGVGAAAEVYYNKSLCDLSLAQTAAIAGLAPEPSNVNPTKNPERTKKRAHQVLRNMLRLGTITQTEYDTAITEEVETVYDRPERFDDSFPAQKAREEALAIVGPDAWDKGGFVVSTTIDPNLQTAMEEEAQTIALGHTMRQGWKGAHPATDPEKKRMSATNGTIVTGRIYDGIVASRDAAAMRVNLGYGRSVTVGKKGWEWSKNTPPAGGDIVTVRVDALVEGSQTEFSGVLVQRPETQVALITLDSTTRGIRAVVGGFGTGTGFNRALMAKRQAGSTIKPFIIAAAINAGMNPTTACIDARFTYNDPKKREGTAGKYWSPANYHVGTSSTTMTLRDVIATSNNICSARLIFALDGQSLDATTYDKFPGDGIDRVMLMAKAAGVEIPQASRVPALALGVNETTLVDITNGYATLGNLGVWDNPYLIEKIVDRNGTVVYQHRSTSTQNIDPTVAYMTLDVLRATVEDGKGTALALQSVGIPVAGKTGTTNSFADARFIGGTSRNWYGCWIGYDDQRRLLGSKETGGRNCVPAVGNLIRAYEGGLPYLDFPGAPGVVKMRVNTAGDKLALPGVPGTRYEVYRKGTEPSELDTETGSL